MKCKDLPVETQRLYSTLSTTNRKLKKKIKKKKLKKKKKATLVVKTMEITLENHHTITHKSFKVYNAISVTSVQYFYHTWHRLIIGMVIHV